MEDKNGEWRLRSGIWAQSNDGFSLISTAQGRPVSPHLSVDDIASLLNAPVDDASTPRSFPPEFKFSPEDGKPLLRQAVSRVVIDWMPPSGNAYYASTASTTIRGLRQAAHSLELTNLNSRRADADPDEEMEPPPPGDYEFFSGTFGTLSAALLALDPSKGLVFGWLPASRRWAALEGVKGQLLEECRLSRTAWRAEVSSSAGGLARTVFLPTEQGIACLTPDMSSLSYGVTYIGDAPVVGAPIAFDNKVWAPLRQPDGSLRFVGLNDKGQLQAEATIDLTVDLGQMGLPVSYSRNALWLSSQGVLRLQKQADGRIGATFVNWPRNFKPSFEFGCPYLASDGGLWQLCFDAQEGRYAYVRIDRPEPEIEPTTAPRLSSGSVNFRFTSKSKSPPWQEPEHGDDTGSNEFVVPLLESPDGEAVIGLRLASQSGLAEVLESKERMQNALYFDGASHEVRFHSSNIAEPWRVRLFIHDGTLWAYHPLGLVRRIQGWRLA
jgi:hypothetical protein